ncbi:MAG: hypothetical protein ACI8VC_002249 [Candidatus Endobugula sp.]
MNRAVLQFALHHCKKITLDIDATEIIADKADAQWTYNTNKGFMPMVGQFAEAGQVVAVHFREGNTSPAKGNLSSSASGLYPKAVRSMPCVLMPLAVKPTSFGIVTIMPLSTRFAPKPVRRCEHRLP